MGLNLKDFLAGSDIITKNFQAESINTLAMRQQLESLSDCLMSELLSEFVKNKSSCALKPKLLTHFVMLNRHCHVKNLFFTFPTT